jgi:uncharacterized protein YeaO (DUF488 family)
MIHEKIVSKDKQSVESIESESSNVESNRSMKDNRRASISFIEIFEDELENAKISYHVRNVDQLKYWLKKDENALIKAWMNIRDESIFVMNEYNKKIMKFDEFTEKYNDRLNELNDAKLMIRELKIELREKNLKSSNIFLSTIEDEIVVLTATFKKLFDSSILSDYICEFINWSIRWLLTEVKNYRTEIMIREAKQSICVRKLPRLSKSFRIKLITIVIAYHSFHTSSQLFSLNSWTEKLVSSGTLWRLK